MDVTTYSEARNNLKALMDRVIADRTPIVVTRRRSSEAVVMLSLEDWSAVEETLHLLSSATNAKRLHGAIAELEAGGGNERALHPE